MRRIAVLTSGGDAPGMNAAIRSVVRVGIFNKLEVYGVYCGYEGLIAGDIKPLLVTSVGDILHRGGTFLKTARSKEFRTEDGIAKAIENLKNFEIDALVVIGGDGSYRGAIELMKRGIKVIGLPGTIDNDLSYTDYTIGFDTALNTVIDAIGNIRDTSSSHGTVNIIEVMGRDCGDIALYGALSSGAEAVIIPELNFDVEELITKLKRGRARGKSHSIILLAEGVGKPYELAKTITEKMNADVKVSVIGYLQRGGSPSAFDRILASRLGAKAIDLLQSGVYNKALGIIGNEIIAINLEESVQKSREYNKEMFELATIRAI